MTTPDDRGARGTAGRLRTIIIADAVLAASAGLFTIAMYLTVARIGWLFWVGIFVLGISALITTSLLPLRGNDVFGALLRLSIANWAVAIGATFIATFQWPLQLQVALLPIVLAATFVERSRLQWFVVLSLAVAGAVAALGLLQDTTGLSDEVPDWLKTAVLLITAPPFAVLVVLVTVAHNRQLEAVLDDERRARHELAEQATELRRSRARVVAATDRERQRIERDLHDGAQSRLVAVNLKLAAARAMLAGEADDGVVDGALDDVRREVHLAHDELRSLAHGLYPTVLTQHGLVAAIGALADRSPAPIVVDLATIGRLSADVEAAVYFCVLEAVQNAAKHAAAGTVWIRLHRSESVASFAVVDDGVGFDPSVAGGHGLSNMRDRLGAIGGSLRVQTGRGSGTAVLGEIPVEPGPLVAEAPDL